MEGFCLCTCATCDAVDDALIPAVIPVDDVPVLPSFAAPEMDETTAMLLEDSIVDASPELLDLPELPALETLADERLNCRAALLPAIANATELSSLSAAVGAVPAVEALLDDEDTVATLFAPTNEAFEDALDRLGITLDDLVAEPEVLSALLRYHVVPDVRLTPADLARSRRLETALEGYVLIGGSADEIEAFASTAALVGDGVPICRSIIYLIDEVLLPEADLNELLDAFATSVAPSPEEETVVRCREGFNAFFAISSDDTLSTFSDLLNAAQLSGPLAGERPSFTVFAPTNGAFERALESLDITVEELLEDAELLEGILKYHIIRGENWEEADIVDGRIETWNGTSVVVEVDGGVVLSGVGSGASVTQADIDFSCTSAVHKINNVLLPFRASPSAATAVETTGDGGVEPDCQVGTQDFFQVLSSTPQLTIWSQVIQLAGMRSIFADKSISVTMFAPSDAAFGVLLPPNVGFSELVADPILARVLVSYHTVAGAATSRQINPEIEVETLLIDERGRSVNITIQDNPLGIIDLQIEAEASLANVVSTDIIGCNSVIHMIDTVLLPYEDFFPSERIPVEDAVIAADAFGSLLLEANEQADDEEAEDEVATATSPRRRRRGRSSSRV